MLHVLVCASASRELQLRNKLSGDFYCLLRELGKQRHNNFFLFPACLPFSLWAGSDFSDLGKFWHSSEGGY